MVRLQPDECNARPGIGTGAGAEQVDQTDAIVTHQRLVAALADRKHQVFTRDQVAWLMAQAMRWGYEHRVDEENEAWPDTTIVFNAGETIRAIERKRLRDESDAAVLAEVSG